jgi:hypothetical protein
MDDVGIILGYPWMDSLGATNINMQSKFIKIWYNKQKITLQNISLNKQQWLKVAHEEVLTLKLIS